MAQAHPTVGAELRQLLHLFESGLSGLFTNGAADAVHAPAARGEDARLEAWRHSRARAPAQRLPGAEAARAGDLLLVARGLRARRLSRAAGRAARASVMAATRAARASRARAATSRASTRSSTTSWSSAAARAAASPPPMLAESGARVAIVEEGGHFSRRDFNMQEAWAYPNALPGARQPRDRRPRRSSSCRAARSAAARRSTGRRRSARPRRCCASGRERHGVRRPRRRDAGAALRRRRAAPVDRPRHRGRRQPQQPQALGRRHQPRLGARADPPQRQGLRAPRLLRHGLSRSTPSSRRSSPTCPTRSPPAPISTPTAACASIETERRPRARRGRSTCSIARRDRPTRPAHGAARETRHRARGAARSTRRRCCCARRSATGSGVRWASAPSCTRRCRWSRSTTSPSKPSTARRSRSPVHHFRDRGGDDVGYFFETAPIHPMLAALALPGFGDAHRHAARAPRLRAGDDRAARRRPARRPGRQRQRQRRRAASRCRIRSATRTARPPSTRSPTWRACSWRRAPARS